MSFVSSDGEHYDEVLVPDFDTNSVDTESLDDIVIMRFTAKSQEPQMFEISNPAHKIIVGKVKWAVFLKNVQTNFN